jgi:hypothetical protein
VSGRLTRVKAITPRNRQSNSCRRLATFQQTPNFCGIATEFEYCPQRWTEQKVLAMYMGKPTAGLICRCLEELGVLLSAH